MRAMRMRRAIDYDSSRPEFDDGLPTAGIWPRPKCVTLSAYLQSLEKPCALQDRHIREPVSV